MNTDSEIPNGLFCVAEIAEALGAKRQAVQWHLRKIPAAGVYVKRGVPTRYWAAQNLPAKLRCGIEFKRHPAVISEKASARRNYCLAAFRVYMEGLAAGMPAQKLRNYIRLKTWEAVGFLWKNKNAFRVYFDRKLADWMSGGMSSRAIADKRKRRKKRLGKSSQIKTLIAGKIIHEELIKV